MPNSSLSSAHYCNEGVSLGNARFGLLGALVLLATNSGCAGDKCHGVTSRSVLVSAEDPCPSVAEAQTKFESASEVPRFEGTVERLEQTIAHPATTMCWYRVDDPRSCTYPTREERLSNGLPGTSMFACDDEGTLYGEPLPADAAECLPTIHPITCCVTVTNFVGADDYPAQNECRYEVSYTGSCGGGVPMGLD